MAPSVEKHLVLLDTRKSTAPFMNVLTIGKAHIQLPPPRTPVSANFKADIHRQPDSVSLGGSQNSLYLLFREENRDFFLINKAEQEHSERSMCA